MNTDLATLQRRLQRLVMNGDAAVRAEVAGTSDHDVDQRLGIYSSAYRLRMRKALAHNFEKLQQHLGDQPFATLADAYITTHPSTYVSVRDIGRDLADWLSRTRPDEPWLAEFACFEWALGSAFDAPNAAPLDIETLGAIEPERWPSLTFRFSSSVSRLRLMTNAPELYRDPQRAGALLNTAGDWLIWRQDVTSHFRSMTDDEAGACDALRAGQSFGDMCELLLTRDATAHPTQAAAFLKRWVLDGLIVDYALRE